MLPNMFPNAFQAGSKKFYSQLDAHVARAGKWYGFDMADAQTKTNKEHMDEWKL